MALRLVRSTPDLEVSDRALEETLGCVLGKAIYFLTASVHHVRVLRKLDNTIHRINHYPADNMVCFANTYPLHSDLACG